MQLTQTDATTINIDAPAQLYYRTRETWTLAYRTLDGYLHHVDIDAVEQADPETLAYKVRRDLASINIAVDADWHVDVYGQRFGRKIGRLTFKPHQGEISMRSTFHWARAR